MKLCWILAGALFATAAAQQQPAQIKFPYQFVNLVWWSDEEIRAELARRIPGLPEEITVRSPWESRIREVLDEMLTKKGIHSHVLSQEVSRPLQTGATRRESYLGPLAIEFEVAEPPKINIGEIIFAGAPDLIHAETERLRHNWSGNTYREDSFPFYRQQILTTLHAQGYLGATATIGHDALVQRNAETIDVPLIVTIVQGPVFHVGSVRVDGGPLLPNIDPRRELRLKEGDVAAESNIDRFKRNVTTEYENAGYVDAEVEDHSHTDEATALVFYDFTVITGTQYRFGEIRLPGLTPEQEAHVRAQLDFKSGDVFDAKKLLALGSKLSPYLRENGLAFGFSRKSHKEDATIDVTFSFPKQPR